MSTSILSENREPGDITTFTAKKSASLARYWYISIQIQHTRIVVLASNVKET